MAHPAVSVVPGVSSPPPSGRVDTGRAFLVGQVASGAGTPTKVTSVQGFADVFGARVTAQPALYDAIEEAFICGLGEAYVMGVSDVTAPNAIANALAAIPASLGPGQVYAPDATTTAVQQAVINAAAAAGRIAVVQLSDATAAATVAAAGTLRAGVGAANSVPVFISATQLVVAGFNGGTNRTVGLAAAALGLIARTDSHFGNAAHPAAFHQGWGAGRIPNALGTVRSYTDSEWDALNAAGVNIATLQADGHYELSDFVSLSADPQWRQLNWARLQMQIINGGGAILRPFLGQLIDGKQHLFQRVNDALAGYLLQLFADDALYGTDAAEAFTADTSYGPGAVNTRESVSAGQLKANVTYKPSPYAANVLATIVSEVG